MYREPWKFVFQWQHCGVRWRHFDLEEVQKKHTRPQGSSYWPQYQTYDFCAHEKCVFSSWLLVGRAALCFLWNTTELMKNRNLNLRMTFDDSEEECAWSEEDVCDVSFVSSDIDDEQFVVNEDAADLSDSVSKLKLRWCRERYKVTRNSCFYIFNISTCAQQLFSKCRGTGEWVRF